jgi:acetolactate synthase regulatory subunit
MRERGYRVVYNSGAANQFIVHMSDGLPPRVFQQSLRGLFYIDMLNRDGPQDGTQAVALVNTVASNKSRYTNRPYSRAVLARHLQRIIGRPSTRTFLRIVDDNLLPNCPITRKDILAAEHIFGPDMGSLKGKTVRKAAAPVDLRNVDIPASLITQYREVVLAADVMFVNKIPFFVTISRDIKFGTSELLPNQKPDALKNALSHALRIYKTRGFVVCTVLMDGQFEPLRGDIADLQVTLNTVSNDEHVPEVERHIRTLKSALGAFTTLSHSSTSPPGWSLKWSPTARFG